MKYFFLYVAMWTSMTGFAQYNQHIELLNGSVVTHGVNDIDSISFTNEGTPLYHLRLNDGSTLEYALEDIEEVGFSGEALHPYPSETVHCIPVGTKVVEVLNPQTGRIWMDRNLGASQVATSPDDELAYGDLYQWGRFSDGHQCRSSGTSSEQSATVLPGDDLFIVGNSNWLSQNNTDLWQGAGAVNNPCPLGYRLPTELEWLEEFSSWTEGLDANGAYLSPLKLTLTGYRRMLDGEIIDEGIEGRYWSSTVAGVNGAMRLVLSENSVNALSVSRGNGSAVRCIKDE